MPELDIEKFNPTKAEITALVGEAQGLVITGVDDVEGYKRVDDVRKRMKKIRVQITNTGKEMRAEATAFAKKVIEKEKELVGLIEPTELELEAKQKAIDDEKEKNKRLALLPPRKEKLAEIGVTDVPDDFILLQNDDEFNSYFNIKKGEWLAAKEAKLKADQEAVEAEKRRIAAEEQRKAELEKARQEGEDKAKREASEKEAQVEAERQAELKRKQDEEAQAERSRKEVEDKKRAEEEAKAAEEKRVTALKQYQDFLTKNGWTVATKDQFIIQRTGQMVFLFKKIDELTL